MSRVRYILLGEDLSHARFLNELLKNVKGEFRADGRPIIAPKGQGSGAQFVKDRFAKEVQAFRSRKYQPNLGLIVIVDADQGTIGDRIRELKEALAKCEKDPIGQQEPILLVIPKWCMETWVVHLINGNAKEIENCQIYKNRIESKDYRIAARQFASDFRTPPGNWLPAMKHCAAEVSKWLEKLG
jgi:hypothetical protein